MHAVSNIMIMSCMSFWQQSSTLSDVWDLLFEEPYPTLSVVIQSWMCGLMSSSRFLFSPQHKLCMHAISNIMIMSCMSFWQQSSTLSDVWDLLFEEPYPTLSVVIQLVCGLRSRSGLVISPRRAIFQWCGGGYKSHRNTMTCASTRSTFGATIAGLLVKGLY